MLIEVTQEDIESGVPRACMGCPIARAVFRAAGQAVEVRFATAYFPEANRTVPLPGPARDFIGLFDLGGSPEPFSFEMEIPSQDLIDRLHGQQPIDTPVRKGVDCEG